MKSSLPREVLTLNSRSTFPDQPRSDTGRSFAVNQAVTFGMQRAKVFSSVWMFVRVIELNRSRSPQERLHRQEVSHVPYCYRGPRNFHPHFCGIDLGTGLGGYQLRPQQVTSVKELGTQEGPERSGLLRCQLGKIQRVSGCRLTEAATAQATSGFIVRLRAVSH
jgi:hypothetical protein